MFKQLALPASIGLIATHAAGSLGLTARDESQRVKTDLVEICELAPVKRAWNAQAVPLSTLDPAVVKLGTPSLVNPGSVSYAAVVLVNVNSANATLLPPWVEDASHRRVNASIDGGGGYPMKEVIRFVLPKGQSRTTLHLRVASGKYMPWPHADRLKPKKIGDRTMMDGSLATLYEIPIPAEERGKWYIRCRVVSSLRNSVECFSQPDFDPKSHTIRQALQFLIRRGAVPSKISLERKPFTTVDRNLPLQPKETGKSIVSKQKHP